MLRVGLRERGRISASTPETRELLLHRTQQSFFFLAINGKYSTSYLLAYKERHVLAEDGA
jgi:hypothetical protein